MGFAKQKYWSGLLFPSPDVNFCYNRWSPLPWQWRLMPHLSCHMVGCYSRPFFKHVNHAHPPTPSAKPLMLLTLGSFFSLEIGLLSRLKYNTGLAGLQCTAQQLVEQARRLRKLLWAPSCQEVSAAEKWDKGTGMSRVLDESLGQTAECLWESHSKVTATYV